MNEGQNLWNNAKTLKFDENVKFFFQRKSWKLSCVPKKLTNPFKNAHSAQKS